MERIAALVVTFNRKDVLIHTLEAVMNQTRKPDLLVIVNNGSTDGTGEFLEEFSKTHEDVEILNMSENLGGAGGFSRGIHYVYDKGQYDWVWLMDDDAIPAPNALETLLSFYNSLSEKKKKRVGVLQNQMIADREKFDELLTRPQKLKARKRIFGMFVGYLIKTGVIGRVGFPREEFFIYSDDAEYTFRVKKMGFKVYTVLGSYIYHQDWLRSDRVRRWIFSKPDIPPWKAYYNVRNGLITFENNIFMRILLLIYFTCDYLTWKIVKPEVAPFVRRAIKDGLTGTLGKTVLPGQRILPGEDICGEKDS